MSEEFSTFFEDAARPPNVKPDEYYLSDTENLSNPVEIALRKFENHPSVQAIKKSISVNQEFYFSNIEVRDILKAFVYYLLTNIYFSSNDSPARTVKDVFYFI